MTIDKPMEPKILEPPLGVSREIEMLGDPCGGDGGGSGRRKIREGTMRGSRSMLERRRDGTKRGSRSMLERRRDGTKGGSRSMLERRRDRRRGGRTGHARHAAEEPEVWRRNPRDGTWRRSGGVSQSGPVTSAQGDLWRPWVAQEETEETVLTIVSIADPSNHNYPEHFDSRERAHCQIGKCYHKSVNNYSFLRTIPFRFI